MKINGWKLKKGEDYSSGDFLRETNLSVALKYVALEDVGGTVTSDVGEDLQIGAVMGHVEDAVDGMMHNLVLLDRGCSLSTAKQLRARLKQTNICSKSTRVNKIKTLFQHKFSFKIECSF